MIYNFPLYSFRIFALVLSIFLFSCSSTEEESVAPTVEPESILPFDISVFAAGNEAIYQVDILDRPDNKEVINLTQSIGVPYGFQDVQINGTKITFSDFDGGSYGFWQKEVMTGSSLKRNPICDQVGEEIPRYTLTSADKVALLTTETLAHLEFKNYLYLFDPATSNCSRIFINDSFIHWRQAVGLHKNRFYLYTQGDPLGFSLTIINTGTGEQVGKLTFDNEFRTFMSEELLYVQFQNGSYKTYNLTDLSLQQEGTIGNILLNNVKGIHNTNFRGKKMVFDYPYPQPGPLATAPAIYDWATNKMTHGGDFYLYDAIVSIATEANKSLSITVARVNLENNLIIAGYQDFQENQQHKGGVVFLNFEGEVLLNIPLDYIPFEIIIRN